MMEEKDAKYVNMSVEDHATSFLEPQTPSPSITPSHRLRYLLASPSRRIEGKCLNNFCVNRWRGDIESALCN